MSRKRKKKKFKEQKRNEINSSPETIQEYFERRTGYVMNEYVAEHLSKALNKYERNIFIEALKITLDRNEVKGFETPTDLVKYMYGVCRNLVNGHNWELLK